MSITNQHIAELVGQSISAMERILIEQSQQNARWCAQNEAEHADFRRAMTEISETLVLMRERQGRHAKNWETLWKIAISPILLAVIGGVIALVLR